MQFVVRLKEIVYLIGIGDGINPAVVILIAGDSSIDSFPRNALVSEMCLLGTSVEIHMRRVRRCEPRPRQVVAPKVRPTAEAIAVGVDSSQSPCDTVSSANASGTHRERRLASVEAAVAAGKPDSRLVSHAGHSRDEVDRATQGGRSIKRTAHAALNLNVLNIAGEIGQIDPEHLVRFRIIQRHIVEHNGDTVLRKAPQLQIGVPHTVGIVGVRIDSGQLRQENRDILNTIARIDITAVKIRKRDRRFATRPGCGNGHLRHEITRLARELLLAGRFLWTRRKFRIPGDDIILREHNLTDRRCVAALGHSHDIPAGRNRLDAVATILGSPDGQTCFLHRDGSSGNRTPIGIICHRSFQDCSLSRNRNQVTKKNEQKVSPKHLVLPNETKKPSPGNRMTVKNWYHPLPPLFPSLALPRSGSEGMVSGMLARRQANHPYSSTKNNIARRQDIVKTPAARRNCKRTSGRITGTFYSKNRIITSREAKKLHQLPHI